MNLEEMPTEANNEEIPCETVSEPSKDDEESAAT